MRNEEIESCIQTLRFLENNFINDHGIFLNDKNPDNIEKIIKFLKDKRWIPCSERLPEEDGQYLISTCMNCIDTCFFYKDDDGYLWVDYEESVIAWMPLPQPYKPTDSEKE